MKKRLMSLLLCLCMVLSLLPVTAIPAAAEGTDWSKMYASDSAIKPAPSQYQYSWTSSDKGVTLSGISGPPKTSSASSWTTGLFLGIPDDAYYDLTFTLTGTCVPWETDEEGNITGGGEFRLAYIVGKAGFGGTKYQDDYPSDAHSYPDWPFAMHADDYKTQTGFDNGIAGPSNDVPVTWTVHGLRNTNIQLDYSMFIGSRESEDNKFTISNVKFTRLQKTLNVGVSDGDSSTADDSGSGTFDVSSACSYNPAVSNASSYSRSVGLGSALTLTAHPATGCYFDHWEDASGNNVSRSTSFGITAGASATDTTDCRYTAVFGKGADPILTALLDKSSKNLLRDISGMTLCDHDNFWPYSDGTAVYATSFSTIYGSWVNGFDLALDITVPAEGGRLSLDYSAYETKNNAVKFSVKVDGTEIKSVNRAGASSDTLRQLQGSVLSGSLTAGSHHVTVSTSSMDQGYVEFSNLAVIAEASVPVTLKMPATVDGGTYTARLNDPDTDKSTDITSQVQSDAGYTGHYGDTVYLTQTNTDSATYSFLDWTVSDPLTAATKTRVGRTNADWQTAGAASVILKGNTTITPAYSETSTDDVVKAVMKDPKETVAGGTFTWALNDAGKWTVTTEGADKGLTRTSTGSDTDTATATIAIPEGAGNYMASFTLTGSGTVTLTDIANPSTPTPLETESLSASAGKNYVLALTPGSYTLSFALSGGAVLKDFVIEPYGSFTAGRLNCTAELWGLKETDPKSDITARMAGAVTGGIPDYVYVNVGPGSTQTQTLHELFYVPDSLRTKVVENTTGNYNLVFQKSLLGSYCIYNAYYGETIASISGTSEVQDVPTATFYDSVSDSYNLKIRVYDMNTYPDYSSDFSKQTGVLYANGQAVKLAGNGSVTFSDGTPVLDVRGIANSRLSVKSDYQNTVYGGGNGTVVDSTDLTIATALIGGLIIYGGGRGAKSGVTGMAKLTFDTDFYGTADIHGGADVKDRSAAPESIVINGANCFNNPNTSNTVTVDGGVSRGNTTITLGHFAAPENGSSSISGGTADGNISIKQVGTTASQLAASIDGGTAAGNIEIYAYAPVTGNITGGSAGGRISVSADGVTGNVTGVADGKSAFSADVSVGDVTGNVVGVVGTASAVQTDVKVKTGAVAGNVTGYNSEKSSAKVGGNVDVTVGSATGNVTGSSGAYQKVGGKVTVTANGTVGGNLYGTSAAPKDSIGAVEVTADGAVTGNLCAARASYVTGDVTLHAKAAAKTIAAARATGISKPVIGGNVTLELGANAANTLNDTIVNVIALANFDDDGSSATGASVTVKGNVTINCASTAIASGKKVSDRSAACSIVGKSTLNINADNGEAYVLFGGTGGAAVKVNAVTSGTIQIPAAAAAPVVSDALAGRLIYTATGTGSALGISLTTYAATTTDAPTVVGSSIYGNGCPMTIKDGTVYYKGTDGTEKGIDLTNIYTIYGGAQLADVPSSHITLADTTANSKTLTIYGGGDAKTVTGTITIDITGRMQQKYAIYGGNHGSAANSDVPATAALTLNLNETAANTSGNAIIFLGCRNGDFNGSVTANIHKDDKSDTPNTAFWGTIYTCSENGAVTGPTTVNYGAENYLYTVNFGIRNSYPDSGTVTGANTNTDQYTVNVLTYTTTPIYVPEGATINAVDPNLLACARDAASGTIKMTQKVSWKTYTNNQQLCGNIYAGGCPVVYKDRVLSFDKGTEGVYDAADQPIRGLNMGSASGLPERWTLRAAAETGSVETASVVLYDALTDSVGCELSTYNGGYVKGTTNFYCYGNSSAYQFNESALQTGETRDIHVRFGAAGSAPDTTKQGSVSGNVTAMEVNQPFDNVITANALDKIAVTFNLDRTQYQLASGTNNSYPGKNYITLTTPTAAPVAAASDAVITNTSGNIWTIGGHVLAVRDEQGNFFFAPDLDRDGEYDAATEAAGKVAYTISGSTANLQESANLTVIDLLDNKYPVLGTIKSVSASGDSSKAGGADTVIDVKSGYVNGLKISKRFTNTVVDLASGAVIADPGVTPPSITVQDAAADANGSVTLNLDGKIDSIASALASTPALGSEPLRIVAGSNLAGYHNYQILQLDATAYHVLDLSAYVPGSDTANAGNITYYSKIDLGTYSGGDIATKAAQIIPPTGSVVTTSGTNLYLCSGTQTVTNSSVTLPSAVYGYTVAPSATLSGTGAILSQSNAGAFTLSGTALTLAAGLRAGTYTCRVQLAGGNFVNASASVTPATVTVTIPNVIEKEQVTSDTTWQQAYALTPDIKSTLTGDDLNLITFSAAAQVVGQTYDAILARDTSADGNYHFVLADGTGTGKILIVQNTVDASSDFAKAEATPSAADWARSVTLIAPDGFVISLDGTSYGTTAVVTSSSTQPQSVSYTIKDNRSGSATLGVTQTRTATVKVCTDGDLAAFTQQGTPTMGYDTATVPFTAALTDNSDGACGLASIRVLAVAGGSAPTTAEVLSKGTPVTGTTGGLSVSFTGLTGKTAYQFYAASTTAAGVASSVTLLGTGTTTGYQPSLPAAVTPTASGTYGMTLAEIDVGGAAPTGRDGKALVGTWSWSEENPGSIRPHVNGTTAYSAVFTPTDQANETVTAQVIPTMTPRALTVDLGSLTLSKVYDGSTTIPAATVTTALAGLTRDKFTGLLSGDSVTLTTAAPASFDDAFAGMSKTVTMPTLAVGDDYSVTATGAVLGQIIAAAQSPTVSSAASLQVGGKTLDLSTLVTGAQGTVSFAISGGANGCTLSGAMLTSGSTTGEVTISVSAAAADVGGDSTPEYTAWTGANAITITLSQKGSQSAPAAFTLTFALSSDGATYTATIPTVSGAEYSFDGTNWSDTNTKTDIQPGASVTGRIRMKETDTLSASANTSSTQTAPLLTVATPTATPNGGTFTGTQSVALACATQGAVIRYTLDGSAPTAASAVYSAPLTLSDTTTIKAAAIKDDMNDSGVLTVTFTKQAGGAVAPVAPGGSTDTGTKVTIPVSSNEGSVKVEATVKDGTAAVTITDAQINEIASGKSDTGTVKMDVSSLDVSAATVPAKVIAAADSSVSATGIEVALPTGTVTLDKTALAAVSDKGGDVTVSVERVDNAKLTETQKAVLGAQAETALVVDVTVLASGEKVSAFGGGSIGVAVSYTPKTGEDTSKLVVWFINDNGTIEPKTGFYNATTGKYEFQTQHLSQYVLVSFPFKDVSANSWYYGSAAYAYLNGLFAGTTDTTFSPSRTMTRGMLVTVLWRMAGKPVVNYAMNFTDIPADAYYTEAVRWAAASKIVGGYKDGRFGAGDTITREQMAAILYRYTSFKGYDGSGAASLAGFADSASVSGFAQNAMAWAVNAGLVQGMGGKLMPQSGATRAQVAAILQRFRQKIAK